MKPTAPLRAHNTRKPAFSPRKGVTGFKPAPTQTCKGVTGFKPGNASHRIGKQCTRSHTIALATRQCILP